MISRMRALVLVQRASDGAYLVEQMFCNGSAPSEQLSFVEIPLERGESVLRDLCCRIHLVYGIQIFLPEVVRVLEIGDETLVFQCRVLLKKRDLSRFERMSDPALRWVSLREMRSLPLAPETSRTLDSL